MNHDPERNEQEGGPLEVPEKAEVVAGESAQGEGGETPHQAFVRAVMDRYWKMMPDEMRKLFNTDTLFNQVITRSAMSLLPNEGMLMNLCQALYQTCAQLQEIAMSAARKNNRPSIIAP